MPRISARLLQGAAAQSREREFEVRDDLLRGFLLRVRPTGSRAYYVQHGRGRKTRIGDVGEFTPDEARERAQQILGNVAHGRQPLAGIRGAHSAHSLGEFIAGPYATHLEATKPHSAAITIRRLLKCFDALAPRDLSAITSGELETWKAKRLRDGTAPATVQRDLMPLSAVFRYARKLRLVVENPVSDVQRMRIDTTGSVRFLTSDEEQRLRDALARRDARIIEERRSGNRWRSARGQELMPELDKYGDALTPAVIVSLKTGLRLGELLKLTWASVDLDARRLTIKGTTAKSGKTRHVELSQQVCDVLKAWKPYAPTDAVIGIKTSFKKSFASVLADAGITDFRWHDLRHSFASKLAQRGAPLNTIRELLGHGTLAMTLRYAHLSPDTRRDAINLLDTP
jgi:integrase